MRIAALVLAIVAALAALGIGVHFLFGMSGASDPNSLQMTQALIRNPDIPVDDRNALRAHAVRAIALPYFILAGVPLCILGGMFAMDRRGVSAGFLLLVSIVGPMALLTAMVLFPRTGATRLENAAFTIAFVLVGIPAFLQALAALFAFLTPRQPSTTYPS